MPYTHIGEGEVTPDTFRRYLLLVIGALVFVYALYPPIKPPYLTIGGSLLGLDPMIKAAK
jgi:hypothetical protein